LLLAIAFAMKWSIQGRLLEWSFNISALICLATAFWPQRWGGSPALCSFSLAMGIAFTACLIYQAAVLDFGPRGVDYAIYIRAIAFLMFISVLALSARPSGVQATT